MERLVDFVATWADQPLDYVSAPETVRRYLGQGSRRALPLAGVTAPVTGPSIL